MSELDSLSILDAGVSPPVPKLDLPAEHQDEEVLVDQNETELSLDSILGTPPDLERHLQMDSASLLEPSTALQELQSSEQEQPPVQALPLVLQRWESSGKPIPSISCVRCRASLWINRSHATLENYCRSMHMITWVTGDPQDLTECQGQELTPR